MNLVNTMNNSEENIKRIINLIQTDNSVDAPEDAIRWSKNIFRTRVVEPKKSIIEKVLAVLQMDISPNKAAFGERSASSTQTRQMLFEAGDTSIDLRISEGEKGFNVKGQVLGEGFENASVKLGSFETNANDLSEFNFGEIPSGKYDLTLKTNEKEILIEEIELV